MSAAPAPGPRSLLARLEAQRDAREFLIRAVSEGRASHAYLFVGPPGAGKLDAAWALAQALVCPEDGCGACGACVRVARRTHPDVRYLAPESVTGYLVGQVRSVIEDVALAPIRAGVKVYILDRADRLRADSANALLKTLEEPPENVVFILLSSSVEAVLPTVASRCQCVPFRMVSSDVAIAAVERATGQPRARCRLAVALEASPARAAAFLKSAPRQEARRAIVRALDRLPDADDLDVLDAVQAVLEAARAPLADVREAQKAMLEQNADYLTRGALKQLEERGRRELSARERSGMMEVLASARILLRDVLITIEGVPGGIVSADAADTVERLAARTSAPGAVRAVRAVADAERSLSRNVTPQLALEVMLFDIRKALLCP